ncbi:hypothetical protein BDV12DRAFT_173126 [Aspergillus spectabilis]
MVNDCSISGVLYAPWAGIYNASKAALKGWSETLRLELQPLGVKVALLVTGSVETDIMWQTKRLAPLQRNCMASRW